MNSKSWFGPKLPVARRAALWRERHPEAQKAARQRYYAKNRKVLILSNGLRNKGVKPPPLAELRRELGL